MKRPRESLMREVSKVDRVIGGLVCFVKNERTSARLTLQNAPFIFSQTESVSSAIASAGRQLETGELEKEIKQIERISCA